MEKLVFVLSIVAAFPVGWSGFHVGLNQKKVLTCERTLFLQVFSEIKVHEKAKHYLETINILNTLSPLSFYKD